jgi:GDP-L-fucose synthase
MPALIRKFHEAKVRNEPEVVIWGTGKPFREFLHVDDMADACVYLMENFNMDDIGEFVNIGVGKDITIGELAELIKEIVGFKGEIRKDLSKPDGTPQKLLDITKLSSLGWNAKISLKEGIRQTYEWYKEQII